MEDRNQCIDTKRTSLSLPDGGYVIYGVAHQHSGGLGSHLYGEVIFFKSFHGKSFQLLCILSYILKIYLSLFSCISDDQFVIVLL